MRSAKDPDGFTGLGQRWLSMKPQTSHPFGLVVKCVLESHPIGPVFDPHMPWTGRWGSIQLNQGVWRLLRGEKKQGFPNASNPRTLLVSPGSLGPVLALGGVESCGCRSVSLLPSQQPGHLGQCLLIAPGAWGTGQVSLLTQDPAKCFLREIATVGTKVRCKGDDCHNQYC